MTEARIVVIPKPGKDPTSCESYRPISLLQTDIKILAKLLASRLNSVVTSVLHPDQNGFVPGRSTARNLRRLFLNIQTTHVNGGSRVLVSLDAAKAFDSVEWQYLWAVLEKFGFPPVFLKWVRLLYFRPRASVMVNGFPSAVFTLGRGTRQGCPLSPLLYALATEPLAAALRDAPGVLGLTRGSLTEIVSLYADDMLLYLADAGDSLSSVLQVITGFGCYSGLSINWSKSHILPLDVCTPTQSAAGQPLQVSTEITYLGVRVTRQVADYFQLNVLPLITLAKTRTQVWARLALSLPARVSLVKMILLPKILYVLLHSPVYIPGPFFCKLQGIIASFIWANKRSRLATHLLYRSWEEGGVALPNFKLYYWAAQLSHMPWWFHLESVRAMELLVSPFSPSYDHPAHLLYCGVRGPGGNLKDHPILKQALLIWSAIRSLRYSTGFDPYTPLWHNTYLPELLLLPSASRWKSKGVYFMGDVCVGGVFQSFQQLKERFSLTNDFHLPYLQLRHAVHTQFPGNAFINNPFSIPRFLLEPPGRKVVSILYGELLALYHGESDLPARTGWEADVGVLSDEQWSLAVATPKQVSPNHGERMTQIYILHRAYMTTRRLSKFRPGFRDVCPKCDKTSGTFLHLFWSCPAIRGFWEQIRKFLYDVMGVAVPDDPKTCLLFIDPEHFPSTPQRVFICEALFHARKTVARFWMAPAAPRLRDWIHSINVTLPLKKWLYVHRNKESKFLTIWGEWLQSPLTASARYSANMHG